MAASTVRVTGWRETMLAFKVLEKTLPLEMKAEAKRASEPVVREGQRRIGVYGGASIATIRSYASMKGAVVRQSKSKVTGLRGDFGSLQMGHLIGALDQEAGNVERTLEAGLDRLTRSVGF